MAGGAGKVSESAGEVFDLQVRSHGVTLAAALTAAVRSPTEMFRNVPSKFPYAIAMLTYAHQEFLLGISPAGSGHNLLLSRR